MNFKRFHESKNLFDPNSTRYHMGKGTNNQIAPVGDGAMFYIEAESNMTYTIKVHTTDSTFVRLYLSNAPIVENVVKSYNVISESETIMNPEVTIANTDYAYLWIQVGGTWYTEHGGSSVMLNTGSEALPYEPYSSEVWHDIPHYIHNTSTDTITTLPAVIYANDTTATIGLKGQTLQSSIPSPTSPVMPQGTGERTGNLTPNQKITSSTYSVTITSHPLIDVLKNITPNVNYTLSWEYSSNGSGGGVSNQIRLYTSASGTVIKILQQGVSFTLTSEEIANIGALFCYFGIGNTDGYMDKLMLVEGSTAKDYEPYGYFIEIEVS